MSGDEGAAVGNVQHYVASKRAGPIMRGDLIFDASFESGAVEYIEYKFQSVLN